MSEKKTVCPAENELEMFKDNDCIYRTCNNCGEEDIAVYFHPLVEKLGDKEIKWKPEDQWSCKCSPEISCIYQ